jgi:zinc/manganese transport system permease protein
MLVISILQGAIASYAGLLVSFHVSLPSGPVIILFAGLLYLVALLFGPAHGFVLRLLPRHHLEA